MEKLQVASPSTNVFPENQNKKDEKHKAYRLKDEKAIASLKEKIPDIDNIFDIHGRIGNGTFSTVLLATLKCDNSTKERKRKYAIKHLIPTSHPSRIEKELKCLLEIGGIDNVVGIELCLRRQESVAFVMPYLPHDNFQDYFDKMDLHEVQSYVKNLLIALKRVHEFNVIHRDVKPSNFLHNRKAGKFMLVDFGLAQNVIRFENLLNQFERKRKANEIEHSLGGIESKKQNKIRNSNDSNSAQQGNENTKSLSSSFKMPLKQVNEIIPPRNFLDNLKGCPKDLESPLSRQIKSEILSVSMTAKLKKRISLASESQVKKASEENTSVTQTKYNANRNSGADSSSISTCFCYGKNQVCNICIIKQEIPASRAGTPGYRPPEVLLKHTDQTTSVDIWAVGVIFISVLSGVYPFFRAPDDFVALAEIVTIFGDEAIRRTAYAFNRHVCMSRKCKPLDLRRLCVRLRNRFKIDRSKITKAGKHEECTNCQQLSFDCLCLNSMYPLESIEDDVFPNSAYSLLERLLEVNPYNRITAADALNHPFFDERSA